MFDVTPFPKSQLNKSAFWLKLINEICWDESHSEYSPTEKLEIGTPVLRSYGSGKFGRILGEFWIIEESHDMPGMEVKTNINQMMIEDHHAVAYHGQSKEEIAEEHIKNRQFINV